MTSLKKFCISLAACASLGIVSAAPVAAAPTAATPVATSPSTSAVTGADAPEFRSQPGKPRKVCKKVYQWNGGYVWKCVRIWY